MADAQPMTYADALASIHNVIEAQPEPARTYLRNGLTYLEMALKSEISAAIAAKSKSVPVVGGFIGTAIDDGINQALDAGLIQITAP